MGSLREGVSAEIWLESGGHLLILGESVSKKGSDHQEAIAVIESKLIELKSAFDSGVKMNVEILRDSLNEVIDKLDGEVWKRWKTYLRGNKRNKSNKTVRIPNNSYHYIEAYANEANTSPKSIFDGIGDDFFIVNKKEKETLGAYANAYAYLSTSEKKLCEALMNKMNERLRAGESPCLAEIVYELRGNKVYKGSKYRFGTIDQVKKSDVGTVKYVDKLDRNPHFEDNSVIFMVEPLSPPILEYFSSYCTLSKTGHCSRLHRISV